MAVPKRKTTPSKRNMRRANHDKVTPVQLIACDHCSAPTLPHRACSSCGYYKGRKVVAKKVEAAGPSES
jgi:large subunit ribosomal protein L32